LHFSFIMAVIRNYYKILGVGYDATDAEIKEAYRVMAKKYHPDLNQGDPTAADKFRNVGEAHDHLSNPDLRAVHNDLLESKGIDTGRKRRQAQAAAEATERLKKQQEEQKEKKSQQKHKIGDIVTCESCSKKQRVGQSGDCVQCGLPLAGNNESKTTKSKKDSEPKKPRNVHERNEMIRKKRDAGKRFNRMVAIIMVSVFGLMMIGGLFGGLAAAGVFDSRFTVTFVTGVDALTLEDIRVRSGRAIQEPTAPVREDGYVFLGWYTTQPGVTPAQRFLFQTNLHPGTGVTQNFTLYAHWRSPAVPTPTVVITFINQHDATTTIIRNENSPTAGSSIAGQGAVPIPSDRLGYRFVGWYTSLDESGVLFINTFAEFASGTFRWQTMTLHARWEEVDNFRLIIRDAEGVITHDWMTRIAFNTQHSAPGVEGEHIENVAVPLELRANFVGWYLYNPVAGTRGNRLIQFQRGATTQEDRYILWNPFSGGVEINAPPRPPHWTLIAVFS